MHCLISLVLCSLTAPEVELYEAPGATIGVAWGNGTGGTTSYYAPFFRFLNGQGITVAAATTGWAGDGTDIIKAGELLRDKGYTHIIAMGHSQGAGGALAAASNSDLFEAVVPIMPGVRERLFLPEIPCFIVSAEWDVLAAPRLIEAKIVDDYPGPIIHATKRRKGHFAISEDKEMWQYIAWFIQNDELFELIRFDRDWIVVSDNR